MSDLLIFMVTLDSADLMRENPPPLAGSLLVNNFGCVNKFNPKCQVLFFLL